MSGLGRKMRSGLAKIGLQNKDAAKLGLKEIRPSDVFICSFPKSGNTWVRFLLANALSPDLVTMKNVNAFVPGIYQYPDTIDAIRGARFIKTHTPEYHIYPKLVYIHRDYRDVIVSYFHYIKGHTDTNITWEFFLTSKYLKKPFGTWQDHIAKALRFQNERPDDVLILSYGELKKNSEHELERLLSFCKITPLKTVDDILSACNFDALQKVEAQHGNVNEIDGFKFFRKGEINQWQSHFSQDQLDHLLDDETQLLLEKLNYQV